LALREDEVSVIDAVAKVFGGSWRPGKDPPDAYLAMGVATIAIEISTLAQHVTDDRGTRSRLSDDSTAVSLNNELDAKLRHLIPDGVTICLIMRPPIANRRKTQAALAKKLLELIADPTTFPSDQPMHLFGNSITPRLIQAASRRKIVSILSPQSPGRDVLSTARDMLEERVTAKAQKCAHLTGPIWLALRDDYYRLADLDTHKRALSSLAVRHPFEKILLTGEDGKIEILAEAGASGQST
jgi:hypothetical protein